ncbi:hypothetical protein [Microvirga sp. KLBC 81]|nr:hypothetical protein [Microvirga sp. KLBC 81]
MRQSQRWHELAVVIILGPLIGLGLGLLIEKVAPTLVEISAQSLLPNQN